QVALLPAVMRRRLPRARTAAVAMGVVEGRRARRLPPAAIAPPSYPYRRPCATARAASARRSDVSRDLYIGREGVEIRLPHWRRKPLRGADLLPANDASAGFGGAGVTSAPPVLRDGDGGRR